MNIARQIIQRLNEQHFASEYDFSQSLRSLFSQFKTRPLAKATLIAAYRQLLENNEFKPNPELEQFLIKRAIRTMSGVTVISLLTKPFLCPGKCVYCPTEPNMPKSYLSNEPAAQRAVRNRFSPYRQVQKRMQALENNGHQVDKIELIILGGTWSAYEQKYQTWFITQCFYAANTFGQKKRKVKSLAAEQKINQTTRYRIIGLTLETRPDHIDQQEIKRLREYGCTRVQLGVQHTDNKILELIRRGDTIENAITATRLLKQAGFKVDHHYMPDLPGSTPAKDLAMFKQVFGSAKLMPDQVKIYPCVVNPYAQLAHWYKNGKYRPYSEKQLLDLLLKVKLLTPPFVRINRLIRDIPEESITAGNKITNLRQLLQIKLAEKNQFCRCLRCREARADIADIAKAKLITRKYRASQGTEYFLSFESKDEKKIYAFLRLRFNDKANINFLPELQNASLVRELHVYGKMIPVADKGVRNKAQHVGFGRRLMTEAEKLTKKMKFNKVAVISGIGVREYYRKLGYDLEGTYMVKKIK